jgi:hypothetical protein
MANLRLIEMKELDAIFQMEAGYVLDFSTPDFIMFFAHELNIDLESPRYTVDGSSKAKRLRALLRIENDAEAVRVLNALWDYRAAFYARNPRAGGCSDADRRFHEVMKRLGAGNRQGDVARPTKGAVPAFDRAGEDSLLGQLNALHQLNAQARGFAFEKFLQQLFTFYGLNPHGSFRLVGEQIDGSFVHSGHTYLLEAKWLKTVVDNGPMHVLQGKAKAKMDWTRGLLVSYSGFSPDAFVAVGTGNRIICMDGLDIHDALTRRIPLDTVLERKVRAASETGRIFVPVRELFP